MIEKLNSAAFMADENQNGELHRNFIFNNEAALKRIRWRIADRATLILRT